MFLNCYAAEVCFVLFSFSIKPLNSSAIEQEEIIEFSTALEVKKSYFSNRRAFVQSTRLFRQCRSVSCKEQLVPEKLACSLCSSVYATILA